MFYGLPIVKKDNILVLTINSIGLTIELIYLTVYCIYANDNKKRVWTMNHSLINLHTHWPNILNLQIKKPRLGIGYEFYVAIYNFFLFVMTNGGLKGEAMGCRL